MPEIRLDVEGEWNTRTVFHDGIAKIANRPCPMAFSRSRGARRTVHWVVSVYDRELGRRSKVDKGDPRLRLALRHVTHTVDAHQKALDTALDRATIPFRTRGRPEARHAPREPCTHATPTPTKSLGTRHPGTKLFRAPFGRADFHRPEERAGMISG